MPHATLYREQLRSHKRTALDDTIAYLQGFDDGLLWTSEVHELFTKIHDILDIAVSRWVGNIAHILPISLNLPQGSVVKSGLPTFLFFTVLRIPFLLVSLACMVKPTFPWHRTKTNPPCILLVFNFYDGLQSQAKNCVLVVCSEMASARIWWCLLSKEASPLYCA